MDDEALARQLHEEINAGAAVTDDPHAATTRTMPSRAMKGIRQCRYMRSKCRRKIEKSGGNVETDKCPECQRAFVLHEDDEHVDDLSDTGDMALRQSRGRKGRSRPRRHRADRLAYVSPPGPVRMEPIIQDLHSTTPTAPRYRTTTDKLRPLPTSTATKPRTATPPRATTPPPKVTPEPLVAWNAAELGVVTTVATNAFEVNTTSFFPAVSFMY